MTGSAPSGMQVEGGRLRLQCHSCIQPHACLDVFSKFKKQSISPPTSGSCPSQRRQRSSWQLSRLHRSQQRHLASAEDPNSGSFESQVPAPSQSASPSQDFEGLDLEELQRASADASEGPSDATTSAPAESEQATKRAESRHSHAAVAFVLAKWSRLHSLVSSLIGRVIALLSWIPQVAQHRKLAKLKADFQENPAAPEK